MEAVCDFGAWLREQIEGRAMTQEAFARSADLPLVTLRAWLNQPKPNLRIISRVKLARALGVSRAAIDRVVASCDSSPN